MMFLRKTLIFFSFECNNFFFYLNETYAHSLPTPLHRSDQKGLFFSNVFTGVQCFSYLSVLFVCTTFTAIRVHYLIQRNPIKRINLMICARQHFFQRAKVFSLRPLFMFTERMAFAVSSDFSYEFNHSTTMCTQQVLLPIPLYQTEEYF